MHCRFGPSARPRSPLDRRSGYDGGAQSCWRNCSVRLLYANAGFATAQIFEAEAVGGANVVDLGLNATRTHDAGLGVHRGGREITSVPGGHRQPPASG